MHSAPTVFIITFHPSPYQVELFNAIAESHQVDLKVAYLHRRTPGRKWSIQDILHDHVFVSESQSASQKARDLTISCDLVVFSYYRDEFTSRALQARAQSRRPWVFWGERPGFHGWPILGRMLRRWKLRALHTTQSPIWCIGKMAVDAYRREFGEARSYFNFPYFSNLDRFTTSSPPFVRGQLLYSGSFIHRKGIDLLVEAFLQVASKHKHAQLQLMGDGPLWDWVLKKTDAVRDRCTLLGFRDWEQLPAFYAQGGVLCAPSRHDGWGLVIPEGLASGLPVITTTGAGAGTEFIRQSENGWLVPPGSLSELTRVLEKAVTLDAAQYAILSKNARLSVAEHTLHRGAQRFVTCVHSSLACRGRQAPEQASLTH